MDDDPAVVSRSRAQSGRVSYTEPIRIGPKTNFKVLLQYVPHNSGPDTLSPKLIYWRQNAKGFPEGEPAEFTLTQEEAISLRDVLNQGLAVAEASSDGNFLVIPLDNVAAANLIGRDPAQVGRALAGILTKEEILTALREDTRGSKLLNDLQGVVRLGQLSGAVDELADLLDSGESRESVYQDWCERHSWAFGNAYTMRDSVRTIALGDQVDLLLKQTGLGLRDIYELKRPDQKVLFWDESHRSYYWANEASKAIGQCHRYLDALHEAAGRGLRDHPEIVAYHPKAVIVIGRSRDWSEAKSGALHGLNARLHGILIMTYDQLLAQARQLLEVLSY